MSDAETNLLTEQLSRMQDHLTAQINLLNVKVEHNEQLASQRMTYVQEQIKNLISDTHDHEQRIRALNDSATTFKTWTSLSSGGGFLTGLIAIIRSFFNA